MNKMRENWIEFQDKTYRLKPGDTALETMLRGGADVAFSCRKGACRSCMLEAVTGDPGPESQERLPEDLRKKNLFLPCMACNVDAVEARIPDTSQWFSQAVVAEKTEISDGIWQVMLEPPHGMEWRPGQFINLRGPNGDVRSYSIASRAVEDYFIELHIRHYPGGKISDWVVGDMTVGETVEIQGPTGVCCYDTDMNGRALLMISNGTGAAPMLGVLRAALSAGHEGDIRFVHAGRSQADLYLTESLNALAKAHSNLTVECVLNDSGSFLDTVFTGEGAFRDHVIFTAGNPDMVEQARIKALYYGAALGDLYADPFDTNDLYQPRDKKIMEEMRPEPALWQALDAGEKLATLLDEFYTIVYDDARLAPFFHKVTKTRAIEKQYDFLRDMITGSKQFFGERPFNSHHWMVISDQLFNYREEIFFDVVRRHGIDETLISHWAAMHEAFRREIVKPSPRGIYREGKEHVIDGYQREVITVDSVCDGCFEEILTGSTGQMHRRTGELFCENCSA